MATAIVAIGVVPASAWGSHTASCPQQ